MTDRIFLGLTEKIETFLDNWSEGMDQAGYLRFTTAKREDCIQSFWHFLDPLIRTLKSGEKPSSFGELIKNDKGWNDRMVAVARRHRFRGVPADMFLGCFKTFIHAIEKIIHEMEASTEEKYEAINLLRRFSDASETIFVRDWSAMSRLETHGRLEDTNRRLTLEKNKYENILAATSDIVMVTDPIGMITEANAAAYRYFGEGLLGHLFWEVLGLDGCNIFEVTRYYDLHVCHEINLNKECFFHFQIIPLESVSLASKGFMLLLTDISCLVGQRESLEKTVSERTTALSNTEKQFSSLFQAAGEGILLIDIDFKVIEANQRSAQVFGLESDKLIGISCKALCHPQSELDLEQAIRNLDEEEIWEGEIVGRRADGQGFPMGVTINRVDLDIRTLFHVLVRDDTKRKELEDRLISEKAQLEEMNITLRNVMRSIDKENDELRKTISHKVETLILPALDKVQNEGDWRVRKGYFDIIRDQLVKLSSNGGVEQNAYLLKLTPTEMKICHFVQAGSTTKEIAESMCISVDTIQTHRKNIRKKLGLRGMDVNLFTFLNTQNPQKTVLSAPFDG
jgi:PAS domain S-box-containing protein